MTDPTNPLDGQMLSADHARGAVEGPNPAPTSQSCCDDHGARAGGGGPNIRSGHRPISAQMTSAAAEQSPEQANQAPAPINLAPARAYLPAADQKRRDAQGVSVGGGDPLPSAPAMGTAASNPTSPVLADPLLGMAAEVLDDLERVRIANENRLRQLTRDTTDSDGEERGFGLTLDHPDVARLAALVDALTKAEHNAALNLRRLARRHPLGPWVAQARGVGEKQAGRLIAAIGDPYWNTLHDRPRTVSELWAYCGYHVLRTGQSGSDAQIARAGSGSTGGNPDQRAADAQRGPVGVAASRARGQRANWSSTAKMRGHLVAASIVKQLRPPCARPDEQSWADHVDDCQCSPYRVLYDNARRKYAGTLHPVECRRCGPAGQPAPAGSPRSAGHQEAMAYRVVVKTLLRDLWREARRLHNPGEDMETT